MIKHMNYMFINFDYFITSGVDPHSIRGTRTGVYIGCSMSEAEEAHVSDIETNNGYALTGCSKSLFANRISYAFDFKGPSYILDTACSSGLLAFQNAVANIRSGEIDMAVVGGCNLVIRPSTSVQFSRLGMLSPDGACKVFDSKANGYVRSETCSIVFLQKKRDAKRIYATVIHTKTNTDGFKEDGLTYPSWMIQRNLMHETVVEAGVNPLHVNYIEAHGTGTPVGDPQETRAIADVFCKQRNGPLLIGAVKSNLGHSEPASGLCSLAKVLISLENKCIPANLHFESPNTNIESLNKGLIKPINENTKYDGGIVGLNSFGFGGVNVHLLLKSFEKDTTPNSFKIVEKVPRLVPLVGRTEEAVNHIFDYIQQNPDKITNEFLALLTETAKTDSSLLSYRGYLLVNDKNQYLREVQRVEEKKPVWFIYSGLFLINLV